MYNKDLLKIIDLEIDISKLKAGPINTKKVFHKSDLWTSGIKARFKNDNTTIKLKDIEITLLHKELDHKTNSVNTQKLEDDNIIVLFPSLVKDEVGTNTFCFLLEHAEQKVYTQSYTYEVIK